MHPELFRFHVPLPGSYGYERPVTSYGALIILGVTFGILLGLFRARRYGLGRDDVLHVGLLGVAGGIVGAAGLYVLVHLPEFIADPALLKAPGLVFYGGLGGGGFAAWLYCKKFGVSMAAMADCAAPALALGHAFGRVGCLMGGCCYGTVVDAQFPFAVEMAGAHRHPVQAYEALGLLVLCGALLALSSRLRPRPGSLFLVYVGAYALLRILTETFRGDDVERGRFHGISTSQAIAALVVAAIALVLVRGGRTRPAH